MTTMTDLIALPYELARLPWVLADNALSERVPETLPLLRRMLRAQPSSHTACPAPWVGRGSSA